jgi:structural maintenance of chromosomes protein 5
VSTIMFLLSLQVITQTPFRVVDEINQGMDQTNERKVFQAMVDASKKKSTAQCLLMTPKLLPQLDYGDCVNVLGIQNAAHMKDLSKKFKASRQLESSLGVHVHDD